MSQIAPNFGRTVYEPVAAATPADDESVPDNIRGLRFDAKAMIVVSAIIGCWFLPLGLGGIGAGVLYLLASKPATTTTNNMASDIRTGDRAGGCFWYMVTGLLGVVAFVLGLAVIAAFAMAGR